MSADNTSLRNLLLGSALGFGISITSVYSVLRLMRAQREAENDKKVKEYETRAMAAEDELANVRVARDKLQRLLQLSEQSAVELREAPLSGLDASSKLCGSEVEKLRAVFNLFDSAQSGVVSLSGIQALHEKLGEPLTDIEAAEAVRALDRDGSGIVTFDKFLLWWYESHRGGKKSDAYTQRFKLLSAKLQTTDFDSQRVIVQETGERATLQFRVNYYYKQPSGALKPLSPWHDIPLCCVGDMDNGSQLFNFICEIPKWTRAKFEIATGEIFNPIKQDVKNGALRYLRYGDQMFNYGAMPQTWEDPKHISDETGLKGDNDPIDVLELGTRQRKVGEVVPVKVLGILALIDDQETDWKIIAISIDDPLAADLNDIDDVERHMPGAINAVRTYFTNYKSWDGCINEFALNAQAMPRAFAHMIIDRVHQQWRTLHLRDKIHTV